MSPAGFPGGSFRRRVSQYGESVTFENDVISTDDTTDWDDATITTTTTTTDAVVQRQSVGRTARDAEGDEVLVSATVYVHDDDLDGFEIRDGAMGAPTTITVASGVEYVTLIDSLRPNGVHEIEVTRT